MKVQSQSVESWEGYRAALDVLESEDPIMTSLEIPVYASRKEPKGSKSEIESFKRIVDLAKYRHKQDRLLCVEVPFKCK